MRAAAWAAVAGLTAFVFWPALGAGFVGDDFMILHRLRAIDGAGDALRFFRGEFFEYYRPLGFVSHAADWLAAGPNPWRFHLTNLLLHLANTTLVFLIASASPLSGASASQRTAAGTIAALLFGLHASNHEPVIWMSARFDLLATFFGLAGMLAMVARPASEAKPASPKGARERSERDARGGGAPRALSEADGWSESAKGQSAASLTLAGLLFLFALLSKESVVALPIAAAAWSVFVLRDTRRAALWRTFPWLAALAFYALLRATAGGVPAAGGRFAKLVAFGAVLIVVIAMGGGRWLRAREWLRPRRGLVVSTLLAATLVAGAAAEGLAGPLGELAREKLSVAGFAIFYLLSPVVDLTPTPYFLDPDTRVYWLGGLLMLAVAVLLVSLLWRRLLELDAAWFAILFLVATLIPISALTGGKRYLYLPSAAIALLAARLIVEVPLRARRLAALALAAFVSVSAWQIGQKAEDWVWAGRMTADGAALVDGSLAPTCGGRVVFLTSPVGIRGVYTHFYYETFEPPRGCIPDEFYVLARVVRLDTYVDVRWEGSNRIVIIVPEYEGNFVLSHDLRHFDVPVRRVRDVVLSTPLGVVRAEEQGSLQRFTLTLSGSVPMDGLRVFYYSEGAIRSVAREVTAPPLASRR